MNFHILLNMTLCAVQLLYSILLPLLPLLLITIYNWNEEIENYYSEYTNIDSVFIV